MSDWGPVFVAVMLFLLLTPGLLIQIPGRSRYVEFGNFQTSGVSILVHSIIYFALMCIFLIAIGVHIYSRSYITRPPPMNSLSYSKQNTISRDPSSSEVVDGRDRISPGDRNANSAEAINGAAQSLISLKSPLENGIINQKCVLDYAENRNPTKLNIRTLNPTCS
ncbi:rhodanese-like domain-containing protein 4 [Hibiscus syriacus]|uniref:Rhodanese-like domain-containing protein 4 n=1 Tax=Hibiscus syriacus TaxID=106335 RepID=A0A6A2ZWC9_HIBSY|nr:rhodanese-like domain-containing protein 4 [Hibiscus syriacus]